MRISVFGSKELQATILALKGMDRKIASQINKESKRVIQPIWQEAVRGNVATRMETRVLGNTARAYVSSQNVRLSSAGIGKSLGGKYPISEAAHNIEFGADRGFRKSYAATSSRGKNYTVRGRRTRAQFRPRNLKGYAVYPAAANVIPRIASLWVQTTVRTFMDIMDGK